MNANPEFPHAIALSEYSPDDDDRLSEWAGTVTADGFTDEEPGMARDEDPVENMGADRGGRRNSLRNRSSLPELRVLLPCPFRKRNPARFNVLDHHICTRSFVDFSKLKRHITEHHRRKGADQVRREAESPDPEDGIDMATLSRLTTKVGHLKVNNWAALWEVLFPADAQIPSEEPCPPVEVFELPEVFDKAQWEWHRDPTTLKQTVDMLSKGEPLVDTAWRMITWAGSTAKKFLDESLETTHTTALERLMTGTTKPNRRGTDLPRVTSRTSVPADQGQPLQRQRPVRPLAPMSAGGDTGGGFISPSPAVYLNPSLSVHHRDSAIGALVPPPPTQTRDQPWTGVNAHATIVAGSSGVRVPFQYLAPLELETSFRQGQHASSTVSMHRAHNQIHIAGNYQPPHLSAASPYTLHHGQYSPVSVNTGTHRQGSVDFTPHSGELYTHGTFGGWQGTGGDNTGEEEE